MTDCIICQNSVSMPFTCSLCQLKFCGSHRLPERHNCYNVRVYQTDEYKKTKHKKYDRSGLYRPQNGSFMENFGSKMNHSETNEFIRDNPDKLTFGSEAVDLLVGLMLIVFSFSFIQFLLGWYSLETLGWLTLIVAPGFILHELGHKYAAISQGKPTRFVLDKQMSIVTVIMGLLPFGIAGPGAMTTFDYASKEEMGKFAFAGPIVNLVLAILYMTIFELFYPVLFIYTFIILAAVKLTLFLGLFNMIPFGPLDGKKIMEWSFSYFVLLGLGLLVAWQVSDTVFLF